MTFTADMIVTMQKELFLANRQNKQRFISMLSEELQKANCETHHASGDADLLIVQKAVQCATTNNTVLIGDDTDLLVLLCYHASLDSHDLFFCSETKKSIKKTCIWNINVNTFCSSKKVTSSESKTRCFVEIQLLQMMWQKRERKQW